MSRASVWKRLLWKEYREGRWVVLIALVAPALCFPMAGQFDLTAWQRDLTLFVGAAGVHLAIALWAAGKGSGKRSEIEFVRSHLPLNPIGDWAFSMIFPLLVTGVLGLWFGFWAARASQTTLFSETVLAGGLDLATTYAVCYLMSLVIASWAAVLFGVFRVAAGTVISVWTLAASLDPDVIGFVVRMTIGSILASFLFSALARKKPLAFRQAMSLMLMVAIVFVPAIWSVDMSSLLPTGNREYHGYIGSSAWPPSAVVTELVPSPNHAHSAALRCRNYRANTEFVRDVRDFGTVAAHIGIAGNRYVYLASQHSARSAIRILRWDSLTNGLRAIGSIPPTGSIFSFGLEARISPNGRHALLALPSAIGDGLDFWYVDLRSGSSAIVAPCVAAVDREHGGFDLEARWLKDGFVVTYADRMLAVDYKTLRARSVDSLESTAFVGRPNR